VTSAALPSIKKHRTLEGLAYLDIRQAIAAGRFAPGQRIVVSSIAAASGVSRIPVMQALRRLETEGFVRITPHRDVIVASPSPEEFRERFLLMAALEVLCLRESVGKITPSLLTQLRALQGEMVAARRAKNAARAASLDGRFHLLMCEVSGLPQTVQILRTLFDRGEYYRLIMHARRGGFAKESLDEHEAILKALEANDLPGAARAIEHHRLRSMQRLGETP
jgi:DNA-binding GntR family transcriptional regulator